ncbi:alkaline phosphatase [Microbulbifer sp. 2205BS26-8]|uniref:alkaline phosphatase D family protein n=1 Tax=Microbulbifer sp. 2205BS26-8 TaxID=3064386 RepID=UPI00273F61F3|nr:alkaline phosphatase D family protein [Microbulbifer sp. 2205BS26-8]MDP5210432.1 alkaline phosphatase D family protein [Microbulbifer sp. 2205BS26-8]
MSLSRRRFLQFSGAGLAVLPLLKAYGSGHQPFQHGVASGDPLADRVILWTRISPSSDPLFLSTVPYSWQIALDPEMRLVVNSGSGITGPEVDYTVKVDVNGLQPGTPYYYRFYSNSMDSPIGRTRTLPIGHLDRLRFAVTSCSNYPMGYFNVYREIALRPDLDMVLHLGDYLYEYGPGGFGTNAGLGREPIPAREMVTLQDYRQRYAQYRSDPDLQEVHRQHPFICVWDDHETTNNAWAGGAENHNPERGEGDWFERRSVANRVYFEWMPIRDNGILDRFGDKAIYRGFRFGNLVDLMMLDTRIAARDKQANWFDQGSADDPARSLLGQQQEGWLYRSLTRSQSDGVRWRVLGQQVMMAQLTLARDFSINMDQWDGYTAARSRLFNHISQNNIENFVVLTGDIHSSWAWDLASNPFSIFDYGPLTGRGALGGEFVTPGVSSSFLDKSQLTDVAAIALDGLIPHLKWVDITQRGYLLMDISHSRAKAHWYHVNTVRSKNYSATLARVYKQKAGYNHIQRAWNESTGPGNAPPPAPGYGALAQNAIAALRTRYKV